jgi:hypothetical protein
MSSKVQAQGWVDLLESYTTDVEKRLKLLDEDKEDLIYHVYHLGGELHHLLTLTIEARKFVHDRKRPLPLDIEDPIVKLCRKADDLKKRGELKIDEIAKLRR